MTDRPIIFSAPMVRALLAGRKTQTRRLASRPLAKCQPGDRLWVREGWSVPETFGNRSASAMAASCIAAGYKSPWAPIHYLADGGRINWGDWRNSPQGKGRPSIHMPRWASRLTLVVTEVRLQRLQEISDTDATAEGVMRYGDRDWTAFEGPLAAPMAACSPVGAFYCLWTHLHGVDSWNANPDVAALTFAVHASNIDMLEERHA